MKKIKFGKLTLTLDQEENQYSVTSCEQDVTEIEIPARVEGIAVTSVGESAFENCKLLTGVTFPPVDGDAWINGEEFKEIGEHAFSGCSSLSRIVIPESVCIIGYGAFSNCTSLVSATLPDCCIGIYAFSHCTSLTEISALSYINEGQFSHCRSLTALPLKADATEISEDAFEHCDSLADITIPRSVKTVGALAFRGCKELKRVTFEEPNGWYDKNVYRIKSYELDLSDPEKNAKMLSGMDFDDGCDGWFRK